MIPLLLALIVGAQMPAASPQPSQTPTKASLGRLDLYETVIRYQIKSWELKAHRYCIAINCVDAESPLLDRLRSFHATRASDCHRLNQKPVMPVVDAEKRESVIFNLGTIRLLSGSEVEVEGGYFCGDLCMAQGIYHVVRESSGWHVLKFEAHLTL